MTTEKLRPLTPYLDVRSGAPSYQRPMVTPTLGRLGSVQQIKGARRRLRRAQERAARRERRR